MLLQIKIALLRYSMIFLLMFVRIWRQEYQREKDLLKHIERRVF